MPDLRSVRSIPIAGGGRAHVPLPSRRNALSRHSGTTTSRPTAEAVPTRQQRGGALITLAAGRRAVPSMHFSRPRQHDRPVDAAHHGGGSAGRGTCARTATSAVRAPRSAAREEEGRAWRGGRVDAQADMPLDEPRAQVAFKDSMIRGILQFTLRIAFRCVLHRCKSQDIRC